MAYSYGIVVADGATSAFIVPFSYIDQADVHVKVDGVQIADNLLSWVSSTIIELPSPPINGGAVRIYRQTPVVTLKTVYSTPAVLDHRDWNRVLTQLLYVTQEAFDLNDATAEALADVTDYVNTAMVAAADSASAAAASQVAAAASAIAAAASASTADAAATTATGAVAAILAQEASSLAAVLAQETSSVNAVTSAETTALASVAASSGAAATSATNADASEALAQEWAVQTTDVAVTGYPGQYSAKHWAEKAADVIAAGVTADTVPFTPGGGLASTNVGDALDELDTEKAPYSADFLVKTANGGLSAERVVTDGSGAGTGFITWDWSVAGVVTAVVGALSVAASHIQDATITFAKMASGAIATAAEFRSYTASKLLTATGLWDAAAVVDLGTVTGTVTIDFSTGMNFKMTTSGNITLANPNNLKSGQSFGIKIAMGGAHTISFGANWKPIGGTAPTWNATNATNNYISGQLADTSIIAYGGGKI
jgi:hypothetical protein